MWHSEHMSNRLLPDVARFIELINEQDDFFVSAKPITVARAPGRLDLMGGIADYSGALVLQLPLTVATLAAVQLIDEPECTIRSNTAVGIGSEPLVTIPMEALMPSGEPLSYAAAHTLLTSDDAQSWASYVAGVLLVLQHERGVHFPGGLRILLDSAVPPGKGVSSSAALEVATMRAVCGALDITLDGRELALLCQKVENLVVGAPCGIMDQMTSACGEQDRLLALLCQPAELQPAVALPAELEVWGIDSGIRHVVSGADYGSVRVGAFMGYRIIAEKAGLAVRMLDDTRVTVDDPHWHGYLANIQPSVWETYYRAEVPEAINGAEFVQRYGGSTDTVTRIEQGRSYAVRQPTAHPIYEHHRVQLFRQLLQQRPLTNDVCILLGELMYQSHASYSACGLGSDGTDRLVELVRAAGPEVGLYGAKITGGGGGGTVAVLAKQGTREVVERIADQYAAETGRAAMVMGGSSPGAVAHDVLHLQPR